jgi:hypothetical protein
MEYLTGADTLQRVLYKKLIGAYFVVQPIEEYELYCNWPQFPLNTLDEYFTEC